MSWTPDLTYELLDWDESLLATFTPIARPSPKTDDRISAAGSGSCGVVPIGGALVGDLSGDFRAGRYIRVSYLGNPMFTWRIEGDGPARPRVGNEAGYLSLRGRGWIADWEFALVPPYGGWDVQPVPDQRIFNFASVDFPNLTGWAAPESMGVYGTHPAYVMEDAAGNVVAAPIAFPDETAEYIWPDADSTLAGRAFFRGSPIVLTEETNVAFAVSADNYWRLYLNGVPIADEETKLTAWMEVRRVEKVLPAGSYTVAAVVENPDVAAVANIGMFLFSAFTMDANGDPDTILLHSDTSWWDCIFIPEGDPEPGWTFGQIVNNLLAEAQASGEAPGWINDFGDLVDSDGATWEFIPHWAIGVGESLLRALTDLAELGHGDWHAKPGVKELEAWLPNSGAATAVVLRDVANTAVPDGPGDDVSLSEPDFGRQDPPFNRVRARYPGGYVSVDGDITDYVFAGLLTTDARNRDEALRNAENALTKTDAIDSAISWRITPRDNPSTPYVGFVVRDIVNVVDATGDLAAHRTVGLVVEDAGPEPRFVGHWRRRRIPPQARQSILIGTLGSGVLGKVPGSVPRTASGLGAAVPSTKPVIESRVIRAPTPAEFPSGPPGGGGGGVTPDLVWAVGPLVAVSGDTYLHRMQTSYDWTCYGCKILLDEASTGDGYTIQLWINGSNVQSTTLVSGSDAVTEDWADISINAGDDIQPRLLECVNGNGVRLSYILLGQAP